MWCDVALDIKEEFEDWHAHEHMPERLSIPGFLRGSRWVSVDGANGYFILYEAEGEDTVTTDPYLERLNNPTPWSRKMMPHHRNMVRSLCALREGWGGGLPQALATVRLSRALPSLPKGKGLTGAHLLEAQPMPGQTIEQKIRGGDATADWILLIGGYDAQAVRAAAMPEGIVGLYRPAYSLSAGELA